MGKRKFQPAKVCKKIGLKVRQLRNARRWTLEEAEGRGTISWQQLQKIESGRNVTVKTLVALANLFGVHPAELLEDV